MSEKLRVRKPGLFTTVQDLGRPNAIMAGVPPGGAMDRFAHRAANLLAGNDTGSSSVVRLTTIRSLSDSSDSSFRDATTVPTMRPSFIRVPGSEG